MRLILFFLIAVLFTPGLAEADQKMIIRKAQKEINLSGYTHSKTTITVSSEVSGKVLRAHYDIGKTIGKKPFFEIDTTFIDFQIQNTLHSIDNIETSLRKSETNVAYLAKEFLRMDTLHKSDRIAEIERDAAESKLAQARLESDAIVLEKASFETTLQELRERKRRYTIYAPKGWIVLEKIAEKGEIVASGTPLARVGDYRQLVIPLYVAGEELAAIRKLPKIFPAQLENRPVKAAIHQVNPEFNEKTRKLNIELLLKDYKGEKRGGLVFNLPLEIGTQGVLAPRNAIVNRYENPRVTVKATKETVNVLILGESNDDLIIAEDERLPVGTELEKK
ncbi:HlyD family efflux transporter periplasmic adaptor subunit [Desulfococcaceae bacterium HSG7]|nr:HlyD family efflux transporter periplasmic adaptor subunit [Desulfococcaceae bacterium HSG7]